MNFQTRSGVAAPIKDAKGILRAALDKAESRNKQEHGGKESFMSDVMKSVLTGVSYIIPIIEAGGMINAFAVLIAQGFGLQDLCSLDNSWL